MAKLTVEACRAASGLLNWSIDDLATHASIGRATMARYELGETVFRPETIDELQEAFEADGAEITNSKATGARLVGAEM